MFKTILAMNRPPKKQRRNRSRPDGEFRQRCYGCYRPTKQCFCNAIPNVANRTDILILQHQRERSHPFNTARIVNKALDRCKLVFDRNESFAQRRLPIQEGAALLYPGKEAKLLDELSPQQKPKQLVILDGTWDQAKTLFRDIPQLHTLPQFKLAPATPGQYRIRREPTSTSLSTLEATVQSLQQLEPKTHGLEDLLNAFNSMVEQQLAHPFANYGDGSPKPKVETLNIPRSFGCSPNQIVVAYGEATPVSYKSEDGWSELNRKKKETAQLPPVLWVAKRLSDLSADQTFFETIKTDAPISPQNLSHMELSEDDFGNSISVETFRQKWEDYLQPGDLLVVPNERTIQLLNHAGAAVPKNEQLKSINLNSVNCTGVTEFLDSKNWSVDPPTCKGRAGTRHASSVSLVKFLRQTLLSS